MSFADSHRVSSSHALGARKATVGGFVVPEGPTSCFLLEVSNSKAEINKRVVQTPVMKAYPRNLTTEMACYKACTSCADAAELLSAAQPTVTHACASYHSVSLNRTQLLPLEVM